MAEIHLEDIDREPYPQRRPILIVIAVIAVIGVFFWARHRLAKTSPATPSAEGEQELYSGDFDDSYEEPREEVPPPPPPEEPVEEEDDSPPPPPEEDDRRGNGDARLGSQGLEFARQLEGRGKLEGARDIYLGVFNSSDKARELREAKVALDRLGVKLVLDAHSMREKVSYEIRGGDSVERIAKRHGTTKDLVVQSNRIKDENKIRKGDKIKVFTGKFSLEVSRKEHELTVYMDGQYFKSYKVGIGSDDKTPAGDYLVVLKQKNPTWYPRGKPSVPYGNPDNILGTRWMDIRDKVKRQSDKRGLGIHGTTEPDSIGKSLSAGCVRMLNADVEELYTLLPVGTAVVIKD